MFVFNKNKKKYFINKNKNIVYNFNTKKNYLLKETKTIFVYNLNLNINEILLFSFFSRDCSVIDVKLIKDKASSKSKGLAYIEVVNQKDITNALSLTGKTLAGNNLMIKASESEKNLAWEIQMDYLSEIKLHKEKDRVIKYLSYYSNDFYSNVLINNMNFFIKELYIYKLLNLFGHLVTVQITNLELKNFSFSIIASFTKKLNLNKIINKLGGIIILGKIISIKLLNNEIEENLKATNISGSVGLQITPYARSQMMSKKSKN